MTSSTNYHLQRLSKPQELAKVYSVLTDAFGFDILGYASFAEDLVFEPKRNHVIAYSGDPVANLASHARLLAIPGTTTPAAHLTRVGVRQSHRRRGLLTRLMRHHIQQVREVYGEPLIVLWASEASIYPRYGFGLGSRTASLRIDTRDITIEHPLTATSGTVREYPLDRGGEKMLHVYDRVWRHRPGWSKPGWRMVETIARTSTFRGTEIRHQPFHCFRGSGWPRRIRCVAAAPPAAQSDRR